MSDLPQIPASISHKKLNGYMVNAKKEFLIPNGESITNHPKGKESLSQLLDSWNKLSKEVLKELNNNESLKKSKQVNPKSYMALGAMEAHINMAIQALKASQAYE